MTVGLRAAKRVRTAESIIDAGMRLLRGRRFRDVSVDEIAEAAGVSRRTFFRYFPTKEDMLLDGRRLDLESAAHGVRARAPGEDDIGAVMRVLAEEQRRVFAPFTPAHQLDLHRLTHQEPELAARSRLLMEEVQRALVEGMTGRRAGTSELLRARILVGACIMVVDAGVTTWVEEGMQRDLAAILAEGADHLRVGFRSDM